MKLQSKMQTSDHPECSEFSWYLPKVNNLKKEQSVIQRVQNYAMDERVDLFILLEMLRTLNSFYAIISRNTTDEKEFVKRQLTNPIVYKFFLGILESMYWLCCRKPSDLSFCFSGERWTLKDILDLPESDDYDLDLESCNDFACYEGVVHDTDLKRGSVVNTHQSHSSALHEKIITMCITWNVEGFAPASEVEVQELFAPVLEYRPHIVVVCLQEVFECKAHNLTKIIANNKDSPESMLWKNRLEAAIKKVDVVYKFICMEANGAVQMLVFSNFNNGVLTEYNLSKTNLGAIGGMMANKSAVTFQLKLLKCKLQFVGCHLESGESEKANQQRLTQLQTILPAIVDDATGVDGIVKKKSQGVFAAGMGFMGSLLNLATASDSSPDIYRPHVAFAMGDMNFRVAMNATQCLALTRDIKQKHLQGAKMQEVLDMILAEDQLTKALREIRQLRKLREKKISFMPTYKLEEFQNEYSREKERTPSWTDRVLTYSSQQSSLEVEEYRNMPNVFGSDHRPVFLVAQVDLRVDQDGLPEKIDLI